DEIEQIRRFDPLTQRSTDRVDVLAIKPVSELRLDDASIERFRSLYRARFGAAASDDTLYEAVSAGRLYPGMEHWLPLFHEKLETLLDYLPGASVTLDHQAEEARDVRVETIDDFYRARADLQRAAEAGGSPYRPLPTEALYIGTDGWDDLLDERQVGVFSPFVMPEGMANAIDAGNRPGRDFGDVRAQPDVNLYDAVRAHADAARKAGRRVILAFYSPGSLDRLTTVLRDHGLQPIEIAESFPEIEQLPRAAVAAVVLGLDRGFVGDGVAVIGEQDILGDRLARPSKVKRKPVRLLAELAHYGEGDYVVHADHGIGRYDGLETLTVNEAAHDCLRLIYDGGDKLFVPVENIEVVSRYGSGDTLAQLDRLGGVAWQARKARVKQRIREIAEQLIATAAKRMVRPGETMIPPDGLYDEFCARFPYPETEDQL
ncbi:MAG: CarD family transcriptional regulator, partial [Geminicoccales bacterium]